MEADRRIVRLMTWLGPSFPVGAYAYSHGIEYAVEAGLVGDRDTLATWVRGILGFGSARIDADLYREAWQAAHAGDADRLAAIADLGRALRGTCELAAESTAQGAAFRDTVVAAWDGVSRADGRPAPVYPVSVAAAVAREGIPLRAGLAAYLHALAANLVSAGIRLVPLGQVAGQRVLAGLEDDVLAATGTALARSLDDIGSAALVVDWTSMQHETQYTRLFRS